MSLESSKQEAIDSLVNLMTEMRTKEEISDQEFAERLFDLLLVWLKKASIKYLTGLTAPNGPVAGNFSGNLE